MSVAKSSGQSDHTYINEEGSRGPNMSWISDEYLTTMQLGDGEPITDPHYDVINDVISIPEPVSQDENSTYYTALQRGANTPNTPGARRYSRRTIILSTVVAILAAGLLSVGGYEVYKHLQESPDEPKNTTINEQSISTTSTTTETMQAITTTTTTTPTTTTTLPIPVHITYNSTPSVVFGGEGRDVGQLDRPFGVDVDDQTDTIYVADRSNHRMCMFGIDGRAISCVSVFSTTRPDGSFDLPWGISVTPDRQLVVTDNHRVMVFEVTGHNLTLLQIWGTRNQSGSGLGEFDYPFGVAVSGRFVYATDYYNYRLQILSLDDPDNITEFRTVIPSLGSVSPRDVAIAAGTGHIYVAAVDYVIVYDSRGQYLRHLAAADLSQTSVVLFAIAIDSRGQVYLGDVYNNCIHIITASGDYIQKLGKPGTCDGCFSSPYGVAIHDSSGQLIVTDFHNNNVQIFTPIT